MRWHEIFERAPESTTFGMAKKAYQSLSDLAKLAIDQWESAGWTGGPLEQHVKANDAIAQEIEAAFAPIRAQLPQKVTLFRGIIKQEEYKGWENGILSSWSSDRRAAEVFAGLRWGEKFNSLLYDETSDEEIDQAVEKYEKTGYVKFRNRYYVRNKEMPQYYNIYDRAKQFITDGDNLRRDLERDAKYAREHNSEKKAKAVVLEEEIDRDRIVWITNSVNCKEFIVRR